MTPDHNKMPPLHELKISCPVAHDHPHYYSVYFAYLHGGWMLYQCLATPAVFQSTNYKLHAFTATNGVLIASKNSPILVDADTIFLQGAYREFDYKPSLLFVTNDQTFNAITSRIHTALRELERYLGDPSLPNRLADEARIIHESHNPRDTTEE